MKSIRKISVLLALLLASLCILAVLLVMAAPHLIHLEPVKRTIVMRISALAGGQIQYQRIRVDYLPRPAVVFVKAELTVPDRYTLSLGELRVAPAVIPLLQGRVELEEIDLRAPRMDLLLPAVTAGAGSPRISPELLHAGLTALAALPLLQKDGLRYELHDGALTLIHPIDGRLEFGNIGAQIQRSEGRLAIALQCESNLWKHFDLDAAIATSGADADIQFSLEEFQPHRATSVFFAATPVPIVDSTFDLSANLSYVSRTVKAELSLGRHRLVLRSGTETVEFQGRSVRSRITLQPTSTIVTLNRLQLEKPALEVSGTWFQDRRRPEVRLDLSGTGIHVEPLRNRLLAVAGHIDAVRHLFGVLTGGHVPLVSIHVRGRSPAELARIENFTVRGSIVRGQVHIPGIDLDVEAVKGEVAIDNGLLKAENLQAQMMQTIGYDGRLTLGLRGRRAPFHLDIETLADMQQLVPVLLRVVRNETFQQEMDRITAVTGKARGRLIIGERLSSLTVDASVAYADLQVDYARLPGPVHITGGTYHLSKNGLSFRNLQAAVDSAEVTGLSGDIDWAHARHFRATIAETKFPVPDFLNWLNQFSHWQAVLQGIAIDSGRARLTDVHIDGPAGTDGRWRYELSGVLTDAGIRLPQQLQPYRIAEGRFTVHNPGKDRVGITVKPTRVQWAGGWFEMAGSGDAAGAILRLDMDVKTGILSLERLKKTFAHRPASTASGRPLALRGEVAVHSEVFQLGDLRFEPVEAVVQLDDGTTTVEIEGANLCGISVPGRLRFVGDRVHLSLQPSANRQDLGTFIDCISNQEGFVTGAYEFSSRLYATAPFSALPAALDGEMQFSANGGRIYRYNWLAKILALVNVTEILRGRLPDIGEEGFAYESIEARAKVQDGVLNLNDMIIRGASMTIALEGDVGIVDQTLDLKGFVAPLKTIDDVVQNLPLLNLIFEDRYLMAIPFSIRGSWDDYYVIPLSTSTSSREVEGDSLESLKINPQSVEPHEK